MAEERFFMDHGMWHDRVTGQHLYTEDQLRAAKKDAVEEYVEREGERAALDCTEPNRAACPRQCIDFCNKAENALGVGVSAPAQQPIPLPDGTFLWDGRTPFSPSAVPAAAQEDAHPSTGGMPREQVR